MKKLAITLAIVLGMTFTVSAQGGGMFGYGAVGDEAMASDGFQERSFTGIALPSSHGLSSDVNAPLGSGIAVLIGLGAAYAMSKKRKK